jgi:hypothetical protein
LTFLLQFSGGAFKELFTAFCATRCPLLAAILFDFGSNVLAFHCVLVLAARDSNRERRQSANQYRIHSLLPILFTN